MKLLCVMFTTIQFPDWCVTIVRNLDVHQGFYMVLLTVALVVCAYKSARAAVRNIELIKQNDDKRTLPYVVLEVVNDMPFYGVRMVNLGATAAHNVVVRAEPKIEMVFQNYRKPIKFLQEPVAYIAPSANYATDIGSFRDIEKANPSKVYTGMISFENDEGKKFEHEFVLDFTPYTDAVHKDEKTIHHVAKHLEELSREVSHIATGFHKPHVLVEKYEEYQSRVMAAIQERRKESAAGDVCEQEQVIDSKVSAVKEPPAEGEAMSNAVEKRENGRGATPSRPEMTASRPEMREVGNADD